VIQILMHRSLNFLVETACRLDDSHPGGLAFTAGLESAMSATFTITKKIDIWRDVGWQFGFAVDDEEYLTSVACTANPGELLLQVSPVRVSNAILKLIGYLPSATDAGLSRRRSEIGELLTHNPQITNVVFAYDRYPE